MKLIIVLSVILVSVFGEELTLHRNANAPYPMDEVNHSGRFQSTPYGNSVNRQVFDEDSNEPHRDQNENYPRGIAALFRQMETMNMIGQNQQKPHQQQQQQDALSSNDDSSLGYWASYPDAAAFYAKVQARLGGSQILSDKPEVRRKINELAEQKFNQCKAMVGGRERACLGQVTGQVMQLVAAVENMSRNPR